jgi:anti-sigma B factor antagonist
LEFDLTPIGEAIRLSLRGRLDTAAVEAMQSRVLESIVPAGRNTIVDLSGVSFLASQGVRLLITATHGLRQRNASLVLFGAQPLVAESLNLVIRQIIPMTDTQAHALELLAP